MVLVFHSGGTYESLRAKSHALNGSA